MARVRKTLRRRSRKPSAAAAWWHGGGELALLERAGRGVAHKSGDPRRPTSRGWCRTAASRGPAAGPGPRGSARGRPGSPRRSKYSCSRRSTSSPASDVPLGGRGCRGPSSPAGVGPRPRSIWKYCRVVASREAAQNSDHRRGGGPGGSAVREPNPEDVVCRSPRLAAQPATCIILALIAAAAIAKGMAPWRGGGARWRPSRALLPSPPLEPRIALIQRTL